MGHSAGETAHRLHLLRLAELRLELRPLHLRAPPLGNVARDDDVAIELAVGGGQGRAGGHDVDGRAVGGAELRLQPIGQPRVEQADGHPLGIGDTLREQRGERTAQHLLRGASEQPAGTQIPARDPGFQVHGEDGLLGLLEDGPQPAVGAFLRPQLAQHAFQVGGHGVERAYRRRDLRQPGLGHAHREVTGAEAVRAQPQRPHGSERDHQDQVEQDEEHPHEEHGDGGALPDLAPDLVLEAHRGRRDGEDSVDHAARLDPRP